MEFISNYVAHTPDAQGIVHYGENERRVWRLLYERQSPIILDRACDEFISGLKKLNLNANEMPQVPDICRRLKAETGWQVAPVAALISAEEFFNLLANKYFPIATFIRTEEELDYVKEPDIFHEIFGHCPMLTNTIYAQFIHDYAVKVLTMPKEDWPLLQRMFWFTVEFGLINTPKGLRAYGGGILSSISETVYCLESDIPMRVRFNPVGVFRTPYRIDMLQPVYFVIEQYQDLYDFVRTDMSTLLQRARTLGEFRPVFAVDHNNPSVHINAC